MTTLSVPITARQDAFLENFVKEGHAKNKVSAIKSLLEQAEEDAAVQAVLDAEKEPTLYGDIRELLKTI